MAGIWVLVAESSRAKIYEAYSSQGELREVDDLVHSESRLHEHNVTSDLPGRTAGQNASQHALEEPTSYKEHEAELFAKTIDGKLNAARVSGKFDKLIIAAAPHFLGLLRKNMNANTAKLISAEINKNLVDFDVSEIRGHLPRHF